MLDTSRQQKAQSCWFSVTGFDFFTISNTPGYYFLEELLFRNELYISVVNDTLCEIWAHMWLDSELKIAKVRALLQQPGCPKLCLYQQGSIRQLSYIRRARSANSTQVPDNDEKRCFLEGPLPFRTFQDRLLNISLAFMGYKLSSIINHTIISESLIQYFNTFCRIDQAIAPKHLPVIVDPCLLLLSPFLQQAN